MKAPFDSKGRLTFGKLKGMAYATARFKEPRYIQWLNENVDGFAEAAKALSGPKQDRPKKDPALAKLSHNDRLAAITTRAAGKWRDDGPLDDTTAFSPWTAPF